MDGRAVPHRDRPVPHHDPLHLCHRAARGTAGGARGDRRWEPVVVGDPLPGPGDRDRQRAARPGQRRRPADAHVHHAGVGRRDSQLLDPPTRGKDGRHPRPAQPDVGRTPDAGHLRRAVRRVLRRAARGHAPHRDRAPEGGLRPLGGGAAGGGRRRPQGPGRA